MNADDEHGLLPRVSRGPVGACSGFAYGATARVIAAAPVARARPAVTRKMRRCSRSGWSCADGSSARRGSRRRPAARPGHRGPSRRPWGAWRRRRPRTPSPRRAHASCPRRSRSRPTPSDQERPVSFSARFGTRVCSMCARPPRSCQNPAPCLRDGRRITHHDQRGTLPRQRDTPPVAAGERCSQPDVAGVSDHDRDLSRAHHHQQRFNTAAVPPRPPPSRPTWSARPCEHELAGRPPPACGSDERRSSHGPVLSLSPMIWSEVKPRHER